MHLVRKFVIVYRNVINCIGSNISFKPSYDDCIKFFKKNFLFVFLSFLRNNSMLYVKRCEQQTFYFYIDHYLSGWIYKCIGIQKKLIFEEFVNQVIYMSVQIYWVPGSKFRFQFF